MQRRLRPAEAEGLLAAPLAERRSLRPVNEHQLEALLARWKRGSDDAAAADLKISRHTLKNLLYDLRGQVGAHDTMQATYLLRDALMRLDERRQREAASQV